MRLAIELGTDAEPMTLLGPALALSPDGSTLALLARPSSGQSQLYVRRLNELRAVPLASTEGAQHRSSRRMVPGSDFSPATR